MSDYVKNNNSQSQVDDGLVYMDYCYFHQTATLNMCVFLLLLLFSQKTNVTIVFNAKFFLFIFYLNFEKKWTIAVFTTNPSINYHTLN